MTRVCPCLQEASWGHQQQTAHLPGEVPAQAETEVQRPTHTQDQMLRHVAQVPAPVHPLLLHLITSVSKESNGYVRSCSVPVCAHGCLSEAVPGPSASPVQPLHSLPRPPLPPACVLQVGVFNHWAQCLCGAALILTFFPAPLLPGALDSQGNKSGAVDVCDEWCRAGGMLGGRGGPHLFCPIVAAACLSGALWWPYSALHPALLYPLLTHEH